MSDSVGMGRTSQAEFDLSYGGEKGPEDDDEAHHHQIQTPVLLRTPHAPFTVALGISPFFHQDSTLGLGDLISRSPKIGGQSWCQRCRSLPP
jgi:hypothetical protein